ncbi:MAG: polyprenyl synthetase family protein [Halioglobus sp.]
MTESFYDYIEGRRKRVERLLVKAFTDQRNPTLIATEQMGSLSSACQYATQNGGKRIRPILVWASAHALGLAQESVALDHAATAIELMHAYSLVHDDLPSMDDDDLRRGKPSLHVAYNEATAILVGDGLQALSFELLSSVPGLEAERALRVLKILAEAAGVEGMVGGQYIDIHATNSGMNLEQLQTMHSLKTGTLIRASLAMGGVIANASEKQLASLEEYGAQIGLAFQVVDDILDVIGTPKALGKTLGKDAEADKQTYVTLLGLDGANTEAKRLFESAMDAISDYGESAEHLRELAKYIVERDR